MKWRGWCDRLVAQGEWHEWFAWHPVTCGEWVKPMGKTVWLERVERRIVIYSDGEGPHRWEYRLIGWDMDGDKSPSEG